MFTTKSLFIAALWVSLTLCGCSTAIRFTSSELPVHRKERNQLRANSKSVVEPSKPAATTLAAAHHVWPFGEADPIQPAGFEDLDKQTVSSLSVQEEVPSRPQDFSAKPEPTLADSEPSENVLSLKQIEELALAAQPAIHQAQSEIEALRGKLIQAGLPFNPQVGWISEDIGLDGEAGQHGLFVGREIVRGNKLWLAQQVVCAELEVADQRFAEVRQRLLTDVRQRYFDVMTAQQKHHLASQLVDIAQEAVETSLSLQEAKEVAKPTVLQSELELQRALITLKQADNERLAARRKLAALLNEDDLQGKVVDTDLQRAPELVDFESFYDQLVESSPELAGMFAEIERATRVHRRECAEPIPNVTWQASLQFDVGTDSVVTGIQVGLPLPTANRNQGAIKQARETVLASQDNAAKKALQLRQRLAIAYESYLDAKLQMDAIQQEILPKATESLELIAVAYRQGEAGFLDFLTAQRTYFEANLAYIERLKEARRQYIALEGMLLSGSLD